MRREEAPTRSATPLIGWDECNGLVKVDPLAAWTFDELLDYSPAYEVPVNLLMANGCPSIGCAPRPRAVAPVSALSPALAASALSSTVLGHGLSALDVLESEAIHIIHEVVSEFERPVLLSSGGKDSVVVLHLAAKAFWPGRVPFSLVHVDTGHNFDEVLRVRDDTVARLGLALEVASVQDCLDDGRLQERADGTRNPLQTLPLLDAIATGRHDAVFGGARRDEDKACAKERILSVRDEFGQWDPRNQRPELWNLRNGRHTVGQHLRVFPISNWTEPHVWRFIERVEIELSSLYYAHQRDVYARDGMCGGPSARYRSLRKRPIEARTVRYRTVGDMSCTGAVESDATTVAAVVREVTESTLTERGAARADDRISEAAMEDRKRDGYF